MGIETIGTFGDADQDAKSGMECDRRDDPNALKALWCDFV
jgi:hypothetical protein